MISIKAYADWMIKAPKGARITYYRGYLCDPKLQPIAPSDSKRVDKLRKAVQVSEEAGNVTLLQKKHGDFDYEYMAFRRFTDGRAR
tara:strand:+ start:533 stop:790 length:258 start_codon:yes stop_codon:yes gene_type:complete